MTRITLGMLMAGARPQRFVAEQHGDITGFRQSWRLPPLRVVPLFVWRDCMLQFRASLTHMPLAKLGKRLLVR